MLKRQRPASPSPFFEATEDEKNLPEDLSEPMSKRRRYFTPSRSNSLSEQTAFEQEKTEEDARAESRIPSRRREGVREWHQYTGEYRDENTKLHDLHAEQRHRMLFATNISKPSPLLTSLPSFEGGTSYARTRGGTLLDQSLTSSTSIPTYLPQGKEHDTCALENDIRAENEAQVVSQRYEETNK